MNGLPASSPPWLFAWMILFLASFPILIGATKEAVEGARTALAGSAFFGSRLTPWLVVPSLQELIAYLPVLAGVIAVFFPRLRARYLEKRYGLQEGTTEPASLVEIQQFVNTHAPWLGVTNNVLRTNLLAFVYPTGHRRAKLAVFGGLLIMWRRDREAAEAVILHEIAHGRSGDHLLVGAGSFLEWSLRRWWLITLVMITAPVAIIWMESLLMIEVSDGILSALVERSRIFWTVAVPRLLPMMLLTVIMWPVIVSCVPVLCIWAAELNADRAAGGNSVALIRALPVHERGAGILHFTLQRISHPPISVRRWFLRRGGTFATVFLLLLFPAAYFVRFLVQSAWAILTSVAIHHSTATLWSRFVGWFEYFASAAVWPLLVAAILSASWPWVASHWQRLITGIRPPNLRLRRREFTFSGILLLALALLPTLAATSCGGTPVRERTARVVLDQEVVSFGEEITVRYSGLPGNAQDWLSVVPSGAPEEEWGTWTYTNGQVDGVWRLQAPPTGEYEVRVYFDWPTGGFEIQARAEFVVRATGGS